MSERKLCPYCHELKYQRMLRSGWGGTMYIEGRRIVFKTDSRPGNMYGETSKSDPINFCPMCGRKL